MPRNRFGPEKKALGLLSYAAMALGLVVSLGACRKGPRAAPVADFVDQGVTWAYGVVKLGPLDVPGAVLIRRQAAVQGVNSPATYSLLGATQAVTLEGQGLAPRDLAYVDQHPTTSDLLVYAYTLDFQPRAANAEQVDVFAVLRRAGRSSPRLRRLIGSATLSGGADYATVALADGHRLARIADGAYAGQWAMWVDSPAQPLSAWTGDACTTPVRLLAGQLLTLAAGQTGLPSRPCRPLPPVQDLCGGDPTQTSCLVLGGAAVASPSPQPFILTGQDAAAKVTFVAKVATVADEAANAKACAARFYAVGQSIDRQLNGACVVRAAPVAPTAGRLTCAVTVSFDKPLSYLEKVCQVTGVFRGVGGAPDDIQTIPVLKK